MIELTFENVAAYLTERGHISRSESAAPAKVTMLTGGVSNSTMLVESQYESLVVKQSLERLKVKGEWTADRSRILRESAAITAFSNVLENSEIPGLLFVDDENFIIGIEEIERPAVVWQDAINNGVVMPGHARVAGEILSRMHSATPEARDTGLLGDLSHLIELRIKPYFEQSAISNPIWTDKLKLASDRLLSRQTDLVHGDFAPKNLFIRATRPQITVLDFEVAHIGNPAFDLAFFLSHLVIDAHHSPELTTDLLSAARSFWAGYQGGSHKSSIATLERDAALLLPCLLLARVDGLSTVEYLTELESDAVRDTAYRLLEADSDCIHRSIEDAFTIRQLATA